MTSSVVVKGAGRVDEGVLQLVRTKLPEEQATMTVLEALKGPSQRLAVAGGSVLKVLGRVRRQLGVERFATVRLCWADERCVPFDDPLSNRGNAYRAGHLELSSPPADELPLYLNDETQERACERVAEAFASRFQSAIDVALLGMGEDGHIASLFPGHPELNAKAPVVAVTASPKPPASRISLTLPSLTTAKITVILATGESKRRALERLLERDPWLPVSRLNRVIVVTDLES
jgi:6-phosphogluconolactonase